MKLNKYLIAGLSLAGLGGSLALAQVVAPQVTSIGSTDLIQVIPRGQPSAQSQYASAALLGNYSPTLAGNNPENALIGGDATSNLWQRATTGSSVTTTFTYGGPDRWGYWSGTNTAMTVSRTSTAADLPAAKTYQYGFKMARTAGQTGVVQTCMLQALETSNSLQFSGQTAEISFYATAGSTFSAANSYVKAYLVSGTGTDLAAANAAYSVNAGGGGSAWTGGVATGVDVAISTANQRYAVAIPVPAATTQVAVALCFTPVGTAGANDYIAFSGIQLTRNSALTAAAGSTGVALPANDTRIKAFSRRTQALETALQQRYFYKLTETAAIAPVAPCVAIDTTHTNCLLPFPTTMRIAPTGTFANGFATPTSTTQATLGACTTLAAAATVTSTVGAVNSYLVNCTATTIPAAGVGSFLYSNGGTGTISLSSEL
jgi:hypothetical protein